MLLYYGKNAPSSREELLTRMSIQQLVAVDTEAEAGELLVLAMAWSPDDAVAFSPDEVPFQVLGSFPTIFHNCLYDMEVIEKNLNITMNNVAGDTMLAAQTLGYPAALGELAPIFNFPWKPVTSLLYEVGQVKKARKSLKQCALQDVGVICCEHAMATFSIWNSLRGKVGASYQQDMRLVPVLYKMHQHGIRVDTSLVEKNYAETKAEADFIKQTALGRGYSPVSNLLIGMYLSQLGVYTGLTPTGKMKTDRASLLPFKHLYDVALILQHRKISKLTSTYLRPSLHKSRQYPHYHIVSTGRLASSEPNIQNIPPLIRDIYIPDDGDYFLDVDFSQIEPTVAAYLSQDPDLIQAVNTGDVYQPIADRLGISRDDAKVSWLAISYGAGAELLSDRLDITEEEADTLRNDIFAAYPVFYHWTRKVIQQVEQAGYTTTLLGRKRVMLGQERDAPNTKIQGTASEILKDVMILLDDHVKIVASVHDELLLSVPLGSTVPLAALIPSVWHGIPWRYAVKTGASYAALQ